MKQMSELGEETSATSRPSLISYYTTDKCLLLANHSGSDGLCCKRSETFWAKPCTQPAWGWKEQMDIFL